MRTFLIGDIHGCAKELLVLWNYLVNTVGFNKTEDRIIFLGDYVDRGPDSKGVIDICLHIQSTCVNTVFLKGNHEDMLLGYLKLGGLHGTYYFDNGGKKFFQSYRKEGTKLSLDYFIKRGCAPFELVQMMPKEHIKFLLDLKHIYESEKYIAVHAGIDPEKSLFNQEKEALLWIRDDFYNKIHLHPIKKIIIHGHTPVEKVAFDIPHRIMLDTGCVFGGELSCLELNEDEPIKSKIYSVEKDEKEVKVTI